MKGKGYTLIELTVVVFLVGLLLFLVAPRLRTNLLSSNLKKAARELIGVMRELKIVSVEEQVDQVLVLDLNRQSFWSYAVDMTPEKIAERRQRARSLPPGVKIADVIKSKTGKEVDGEISIKFFRQGNCEPTVVHLMAEESFETLILSPFLGKVKLMDFYAEMDPEER